MDAVFFFFQRGYLILVPAVGVFGTFLQCFISLPLACKLVLSLAQRDFSLLHLLSDVLSEVDVRDSLLHHEVDRVDRVLDVFWLRAEKVTNYWYSIALLSLLDVLEVVHKTCDLHLMLIFCISKRLAKIHA